MEYGKIISVTGMGGLFELVGSKKDGAIVKSLEDKSTKFVSSRIHNFSHLESIEVYTVRDNVNLVELLQAMEASNTSLPDQKDPAAVKAYFTEVYPDMDFERVYASDMKKMVKWYSLLKENNVELKLTESDEEEEDQVDDEDSEDVEKEAEKQKASPKAAGKKAGEDKAEEKAAEPKAATEKKKSASAEKDESEADEPAAPKKRAPRKKKSEE